MICGLKAVILTEGNQGFDRTLWKDAPAIIMNDCSSLDCKTREIIKQLTGSGVITYEIKYVQVTKKQTFRFGGVFIIVLNSSKVELISNTGEIALAQRFIEIPFKNPPSDEQINPELFNHLK